MAEPSFPTAQDLQLAREKFEANEPRDLFYRAAIELVDRALRKESDLTVSEAIAVLLQTWNRAYYRYRRFDPNHFRQIDRLLTEHAETLRSFRPRSILTFHEPDRQTIERLFRAFETVLRPVGAAKSLHLLAPNFFPLWDGTIALKYGTPLGPSGTNSNSYLRFMELAREQVERLRPEAPAHVNLLKAIDEYNFCKYTKRWI